MRDTMRLIDVCEDAVWQYESKDTGELPQRWRLEVDLGIAVLTTRGRDQDQAARRAMNALRAVASAMQRLQQPGEA